ncbi:hypothetical protein [Rhodococcus wratislaviensis]|uniref:hypothetical protein n=1 Tax=Rhodococcus wratislaviensis TaxID=44752 RepID=UPI0036693473
MLKLGMRLHSQVCSTEIIVIRASDTDAIVQCGGHPMSEIGVAKVDGRKLNEAFSAGTTLGKRYVDADNTIEVLVTKAGSGSLTLGESPLHIKDAKPLPASD